jgi:molybdopterin-containing oxidoreductase family molybdopterin binding subunit
MSFPQFFKSHFKKYTDKAVPVETDLWPAIQSRLQKAGGEPSPVNTDAVRDGNPQWFEKRLPELIQSLTHPNLPKSKESHMDEEKQKNGAVITRRDFLKVSGATAGAAAVVGAAKRPVLRTLQEINPEKSLAAADEQVFRSVCRPNCFGYCPLNVHVRDGKVVKTSMAQYVDPKFNRICLRGLSHVQRIYNPDRIKYPMKRAGERGEDKWERISWDEAITTITDQWKGIQQEHGNSAVSFFSCSGSMGLLHGLMPGIKARLQNAIGATAFDASVDVAVTHGINRVVGNAGPWIANECSDVVNSKTIITWGSNLTEAYPHTWHFVADALEAGTKLIVVDPVFTTLASKAHEFIQVRPGSDPALTLSMMQVIISENLHNVEFLLAHTVAPFLVRDDTKVFLRMSDLGVAPTDGPADAAGNPTKIDPVAVWDAATKTAVAVGTLEKPALEGAYEIKGIKVQTAFELLKAEVNQYPPEVASKLTEVEPDIIRHLAHVSADTPVTHLTGWGPQAYNNGVHAAHATATLAAITGNVGYPGASVGSNWTIFPGINWGFTAPNNTFGPSISHLVYRKVVKTGTFQGKPFPIKAMYVSHSNPVNTMADSNQWRNELLPTLDLVVVADVAFTDTARFADIVLPVADWFEVDEITGTGQAPFVQYSEKAIEPLYESKSDADIIRLLAAKMGVGEFFTKTDDEYLEEILDTPYSKQFGITLKDLREKKAIRYFKEPYIAWEGGAFLTPSGRMEFYLENPAPRSASDEEIDYDRERLPRFFPPTEAWPDNPLYKKYPLVLLSERPKFRVHSQWFATPWLRELDPEPVVKINPRDAAARNITNGEHVEVFNDRGHAVVKAVFSQALKPGVMKFPKGWQKKQYIAGDMAELSSSSFDPVGVNCSFMDELVEVRKWNGEV